MEPSAYQEAVLSHVADPTAGNAVVNAVAGSGKTATLKMAARRIQEVYGRTKVKAVCFNKAAATQLQERLGGDAECGTLHGVGLAAWSASGEGPRTEVDKTKSQRIIRWLQEEGKVPRWVPPGKVRKVVSLAKAEGLVPEGARVGSRELVGLLSDTPESWAQLFDHYGVETDERLTPDVLISAARRVLEASIKWGRRIVDFDDMLYLPTLTEGTAFPKYPWAFVDETQDVSGLQREMVLRMVSSGGRLLAVGDRNQAIYGWRGADSQSMDVVAGRTDARWLPLSICYRCPRAVVEIAKTIVPQIEAAPGAEEGVVEVRESFRASEFLPGDMVVCRNRAPAVKLGYRLLGAGTRVRIMGNNVSEGLISYVEGLGKRDVDDMLDELESRTNRAIVRAQKKDDEEGEAEARDRYDTIYAIAEGSKAQTVDELIAHVRDLFDGDPTGKVLVGTGHGSKGLEAPRVWILDRHLLPARQAKKPWQLQQESNLEYVMTTRALRELRYIKSEGLR